MAEDIKKTPAKSERKDPDEGLRKQLSQRDRVIQAQKDEIAGLKEATGHTGNVLGQTLSKLTAMTMLVQKRDEVIALQASLTTRLVEVYQPHLVEFVQQEVVAMNLRLQAQGRAAAEAEDAAKIENRT